MMKDDEFDCFKFEPIPGAKPVPLYTKFIPPNVVGVDQAKMRKDVIASLWSKDLIISELDIPIDLPSK
jgi:hypothetical protein